MCGGVTTPQGRLASAALAGPRPEGNHMGWVLPEPGPVLNPPDSLERRAPHLHGKREKEQTQRDRATPVSQKQEEGWQYSNPG